MLEEALAVADPEQRQRIIDDLENFGLISDEEARALEHEPTHPEPTTELDGPPPEDESLTDKAHRLGFDLPDESPETIRRVLDEQEYRTMREAAAIAGLAEAADRFNEEVTRPYIDADLGDSAPELHGRQPVAGEIEDPDARRVDEVVSCQLARRLRLQAGRRSGPALAPGDRPLRVRNTKGRILIFEGVQAA